MTRLTWMLFVGVALAGIFTLHPVAGASPADASTTQPQHNKSSQDLIDDLADPDPQVRDAAAQQLANLGPSARPALIAAAKEGDPRISPRCAEILLQLPWSGPNDPPLVRQMLVGYGQRPEEERRLVSARLASVHGSGPVMARLLREEPSENVAWFIARMLARRCDEPTLAAMRQIDPTDARPAALAMSGRAWLFTDRPRAMRLLRQAIDTDRERATFDNGALDFAFDLLCGEAIEANKPAEAAELRRRQAQRVAQLSIADDRNDPRLELFALHGAFGPLPGFARDLATFNAVAARPEVLYAMAESWSRAGQTLIANRVEQAAFAASPSDPNLRVRTAQFLADHDWTDAAERELRGVLSAAATMDPEQRAGQQLNTYYRLAHLADNRGDDAGSADLLQQAQEVLDRANGQFRADNTELSEQLHAHRLRAARAAHDDKAAAAHLKPLLDTANLDVDSGIEAYTTLQELGRDAEADQVFARAYAAQRARLPRDANPVPHLGDAADDAESGPEQWNNLAWLCARCNQKIPEAVEMATRAIYAMPERAGYLDTAAEAHFAAGHIDQAIGLETHALGLKPNDRFMKQQLARFKK